MIWSYMSVVCCARVEIGSGVRVSFCLPKTHISMDSLQHDYIQKPFQLSRGRLKQKKQQALAYFLKG